MRLANYGEPLSGDSRIWCEPCNRAVPSCNWTQHINSDAHKDNESPSPRPYEDRSDGVMLNSHAKAKCGHTEPVSALTMKDLQLEIENAAEQLCSRCKEQKTRGQLEIVK